jgi:transcriptional regulator with AAA-type ATPase domain
MQNNYKEYLFNFQTELNMNRQQNRDERYEISKKLSENETIQYDQFARFLSDKIDRHGKLTIRNFQPSDYLELKQNFTLLVKHHRKFNQLIQQINQLIADFQDSKETGTSGMLKEFFCLNLFWFRNNFNIEYGR